MRLILNLCRINSIVDFIWPKFVLHEGCLAPQSIWNSSEPLPMMLWLVEYCTRKKKASEDAFYYYLRLIQNSTEIS